MTDLKELYRIIEIKRVIQENPTDITHDFVLVMFSHLLNTRPTTADNFYSGNTMAQRLAEHFAAQPELKTTQLLLRGEIPRRSNVADWLQATFESASGTRPDVRELFVKALRGAKHYSGPDYIRIPTSDRIKETVELLSSRQDHGITKALLSGYMPTREQLTEPL